MALPRERERKMSSTSFIWFGKKTIATLLVASDPRRKSEERERKKLKKFFHSLSLPRRSQSFQVAYSSSEVKSQSKISMGFDQGSNTSDLSNGTLTSLSNWKLNCHAGSWGYISRLEWICQWSLSIGLNNLQSVRSADRTHRVHLSLARLIDHRAHSMF